VGVNNDESEGDLDGKFESEAIGKRLRWIGA
jgi:hypothetical protein